MEYSDKDVWRDVERIRQIPIIPTLLDVVCQITGMGFAAVARVTDDRWITCSVKDDIAFGLVPGSELKIETTICKDIRESYEPVVIDHVKESELFCNHPTPQMYGFQSYVSFPIILKTGEFFGTLCAIDPQPKKVENVAVKGMFTAFADLISFHLQQIDLLEESEVKVKSLNRQLILSEDENRQYRHISSHTLQEPLRKLGVFSGLLLEALRVRQIEQAERYALRIQRNAARFSALITDLADLSSFGIGQGTFKVVDLEWVIKSTALHFELELQAVEGSLHVGTMPKIKAIPDQMDQLFLQLFDNSIKFAKAGVPLSISVTSTEYVPDNGNTQISPSRKYVQIAFTDNGIGIETSQLEAIFDVFSQLPSEIFLEGSGIGLAISRKIIRNHFGQISIDSQPGRGTIVVLVLPLE